MGVGAALAIFCGGPCVLKPGMFYFRGASFPGWVCEKCNALWENPDFFEYAARHQGDPMVFNWA